MNNWIRYKLVDKFLKGKEVEIASYHVFKESGVRYMYKEGRKLLSLTFKGPSATTISYSDSTIDNDLLKLILELSGMCYSKELIERIRVCGTVRSMASRDLKRLI